MKKIIKLTESDLLKIVKKVLNEQLLPTLIGKGSKGEEVKQIQQRLFDLKLLKTDTMVPTGFFGRLTQQALITFQKNNRLKPTGTLDELTKKMLFNSQFPFGGGYEATKGNGQGKIKQPKVTGKDNQRINKEKTTDNTKNNSVGSKTLQKLKDKGFHVDLSGGFTPDKGYFVSSCSQKGCAQFTNDMLDTSLGDAWQAYSKLNSEINVSQSTVQQMTNLFNKMNKSGVIPGLDTKSQYDDEAKTIIKELIPDQSKFQKLPIGTVVGLYFPKSDNYDLSFFQSAIGKSRDNNGNLQNVIAKPYFCKNPNNCASTTWTENDLNKNVKFYPGKTLSSGKSFAPNTHLGFIGYIDKNGIPYVVHNVHQNVYAYPVTKLGNGALSIIWSGNA